MKIKNNLMTDLNTIKTSLNEDKTIIQKLGDSL